MAPYDRDSFLAGLAVGRTLWKPPVVMSPGPGAIIQVMIGDIDGTKNNTLQFGLFQYAPIDLPSTYYTYHTTSPERHLAYLKWRANEDGYSWTYTYEKEYGYDNIVIGFSHIYIILDFPGMVGVSMESPFYDIVAIVNGEEKHITDNYKPGQIVLGPTAVDISPLRTNGSTGYDASYLNGTIWLPKFQLEAAP